MTPKQKQVLKFIKSEIHAKREFPGMDRIAFAVWLKYPSDARNICENLEEKGFLTSYGTGRFALLEREVA